MNGPPSVVRMNANSEPRGVLMTGEVMFDDLASPPLGGGGGGWGSRSSSTGVSLRDAIALEVRSSEAYARKKEVTMLKRTVKRRQMLQKQQNFRKLHLSGASSASNGSAASSDVASLVLPFTRKYPSMIPEDKEKTTFCKTHGMLEDDVNNSTDWVSIDLEDSEPAHEEEELTLKKEGLNDQNDDMEKKIDDRLLVLVKRIFRTKIFFAFSWGFINAITLIQAQSFATMMAGNVLKLAGQLVSNMKSIKKSSSDSQVVRCLW